MPIMNQQARLFLEPNEDHPSDKVASKDLPVEVLASDNSFHKVKVLDGEDEPQGWVFEEAVDLTGTVPTGPINKPKFALQCWREAVRADANPHYMAAVAELRSSTATGEDDGRIGPFRLSQKEWDDGRANAAFELADVGPRDIADWRLQCVMFALMAHSAEETLRAELQKAPAGREPSAADLYLAQLIGPAAAAAAVKNPTSNIAVPFPNLNTPVQAQADTVIKQIADALQPVLDSTKAAVTEAGTTLLGSAPQQEIVTKAGDPLSKEIQVPAGDFTAKAPAIMKKLMADFGLTDVQAAAILGNIGHECAGFKHMQEIAPIGGGRGGLGWCQWTGSRRVLFEKFLAGRPPNDNEANYSFLKKELTSTHAKAIDRLRPTQTLEAGVKAFELVFEVAGVKHYESRNEWGRKALAAFKANPPPP
jgi:hypothetical protein